MIWLILKFPRNLKGCYRPSRRCVHAKKLAEPEVGISQLRIRVEKLWLLVGQGHFSALHVQFANNAGAETLLLALQFLVQDAHRMLAHTDLRPIQKKFVESDSHIERHATDNFPKFVICLSDVQLGDGHLAGYGSASVKILLDLQPCIVIFLPESRFALLLSLIV